MPEYPVEQVESGIYRLPIPVPVRLRYVNSYLLDGPGGWTIIDTGFHTPTAEEAWHRGLAELGLRPQDVGRILITHAHPDHYGCAGWLQQLCQVDVLMLDRTAQAVRTHFHGEGPPRPGLIPMFLAHGMPADVAEGIAQNQGDTQRMVTPWATLTSFAEGEAVELSGRRFVPIWTPGHSDDHCVLWDPSDRVLLAGDHVLPQITPNISFWPGGPEDPLGDFLASLEKVRQLPARLVLPGHRHPLHDLEGRIGELREHHRARLSEMEQWAAPGATAWEITCAAFAGRLVDANNTRFAMLETLAHLNHLQGQGRLQARGEAPVQWYR